MHKFLKLSAVSMLAIMATANANAAGYTCEELVEYTSCNPGYAFTYDEMSCSGGEYTPEFDDGTGRYVCYDGELVVTNGDCVKCSVGHFCSGGMAPMLKCGMDYDSSFNAVEERANYQDEEGASGCKPCPTMPTTGNGVASVELNMTGNTSINNCGFKMSVDTDNATWGDISCSVSGDTYVCSSGGNISGFACKAGRGIADAGTDLAERYDALSVSDWISQVNSDCALCDIGSYASGGGYLCTACPETGLTDMNNNVVTAQTPGAGATSMSACYVGPNAYFQDGKGTYHYKSDCSYAVSASDSFDESTATDEEKEARCNALGGAWEYDDYLEYNICRYTGERDEEMCTSVGAEWGEEEYCDDDTGECEMVGVCYAGGWWLYNLTTGEVENYDY